MQPQCFYLPHEQLIRTIILFLVELLGNILLLLCNRLVHMCFLFCFFTYLLDICNTVYTVYLLYLSLFTISFYSVLFSTLIQFLTTCCTPLCVALNASIRSTCKPETNSCCVKTHMDNKAVCILL